MKIEQSLMRKFVALVVGILLLLPSGAVAQRQAREMEAPDPADVQVITEWLRSELIPLKSVEAGQGFEDLQPLKEILENVRVVGLGEATHGSREIFQFKHRMLEFLVREMGFNVFAIEASYVACMNINDYVLYGIGDPAEALASQGFWTWDTEEVAQMIEWMRSYNQTVPASKRVKFLGYDIQYYSEAFGLITDYLERVAPEYVDSAQAAFEPFKMSAREFMDRSEEEIAKAGTREGLLKLIGFLGYHETRLTRQTSAAEFEEVMQHLRILLQFHESFATAIKNSGYPYNRDYHMAANIEHLMRSEGPDTKMVVWAHNAHVKKIPMGMPTMGTLLEDFFGDAYYVLGFSFNRGSFQAIDTGSEGRGLTEFTVGPAPAGSVDWYLAQADTPNYIIDIRSTPRSGVVGEWLSSRLRMRWVGSIFSEEDPESNYFLSTVLQNDYDGMIFLNETTRARPNPSGMRPRNRRTEREEAGSSPPATEGKIIYQVTLPEGKLPWPHHAPELDRAGYDRLIDGLWIVNNFSQYQQGDSREKTYLHSGIDIALPNGTALHSIADGIVRSTEYQTLTIEDLDQPSYAWGYSHVGNLHVEVGDTVSMGSYIGDVEFEGLDHLHLSRVRLVEGGDWDDIFDLQFLHATPYFVYSDTEPPVIETPFYYFENNSDRRFIEGDPVVVSGEVDIVIGARDQAEVSLSKELDRFPGTNLREGRGDHFAVTRIEYEISGEQIETVSFKSIDFGRFPQQRRRPNIIFDYERVADVYKYYPVIRPEGRRGSDKLISYYVITNTAGDVDADGLILPDKRYAWNTAATDEKGRRIYPDGVYTITATAYDALGNRTTASDQLRVENSEVALVGGAIIDGTGSLPRKGTILIRGRRIVEVSPKVEIPAGATIIDITGKTVLPGLIDMHGHMYARATSEIRSQFEAYPKLFLAGGVTAVRSPGDLDPEGMIALRERIERGEAVGPRIFVAGPYFDHEPSRVGWIEGVSSPEEAVEKFNRWKDRIDHVKFYTRITEDEFRAVLDAADQAGIPVTGHLGSITATRAIELGIDGLEHGIFGMPEVVEAARQSQSGGCALAEVDLNSPTIEELIAAIVKNRVAIDPTVVISQAFLPDFTPVTPDWLDYMSPEARVLQARSMASSSDGSSAGTTCRHRELDIQLRFIKKVHDRGGVIVAGTDPVAPRLIPGYALHRELENFVDAGLTPVEAISAATLNAAIALRRQDELGTIEIGKLADLVVVAGDPATTIEDIGRTVMVFKDGRRYDPSALRESVKGKIQ